MIKIIMPAFTSKWRTEYATYFNSSLPSSSVFRSTKGERINSGQPLSPKSAFTSCVCVTPTCTLKQLLRHSTVT